MTGAEVPHLALLEVGVVLDLVDRRHHRGMVEELREVLDHAVADPDGADLAVREQGLQGAVSIQGPLERRRQRLVQEQQVDLVDAELAGALVEAVQRLVVAVVADPNLGLQEDVRAFQAGTLYRLADLALVSVACRRVDEAVAAFECRPDGVAGFVRGRLEDSKTERGHVDTVVESDGFHVVDPSRYFGRRIRSRWATRWS